MPWATVQHVSVLNEDQGNIDECMSASIKSLFDYWTKTFCACKVDFVGQGYIELFILSVVMYIGWAAWKKKCLFCSIFIVKLGLLFNIGNVSKLKLG